MRLSATHEPDGNETGDPEGSPGTFCFVIARCYWIGSILMSPFVAVTFTFKPASRNRA